MGVDYAACTVVGIEIDKSAFYARSQTRNRGCEHPLPGEVQFCPQCGKQAWLEQSEEEPLPPYDEDRKTFAGLDVVQDQYYDGDQRFFVGTATKMDMSCGIPEMLPPGTVEEARQRLKAALEPLGLWNEDRFGIWTFVQYS